MVDLALVFLNSLMVVDQVVSVSTSSLTANANLKMCGVVEVLGVVWCGVVWRSVRVCEGSVREGR